MNKNVIALLCLSLLTACGGGGGGGSSTPAKSSTALNTPSSTAASSIPASSSSAPLSSVPLSSSSSSTVSNQPLPTGAGILSTRFVIGGTFTIDETSGVLTQQANSLQDSYFAADINPEGYVIAASASESNVDEIDLIAGTSRTLFKAPEALTSLAVSPDGTIVGISKEEEFGKKFIYRFSNAGVVLSKVVSANVNPTGIDFDKDGNLYGIDLFGTWQINPVTGESTSKFLLSPSGQNDIDIDAQGKLRVISFGKLQIFDIANGNKISEVTLQQDYFAFSPLVYR